MTLIFKIIVWKCPLRWPSRGKTWQKIKWRSTRPYDAQCQFLAYCKYSGDKVLVTTLVYAFKVNTSVELLPGHFLQWLHHPDACLKLTPLRISYVTKLLPIWAELAAIVQLFQVSWAEGNQWALQVLQDAKLEPLLNFQCFVHAILSTVIIRIER